MMVRLTCVVGKKPVNCWLTVILFSLFWRPPPSLFPAVQPQTTERRHLHHHLFMVSWSPIYVIIISHQIIPSQKLHCLFIGWLLAFVMMTSSTANSSCCIKDKHLWNVFKWKLGKVRSKSFWWVNKLRKISFKGRSLSVNMQHQTVQICSFVISSFNIGCQLTKLCIYLILTLIGREWRRWGTAWQHERCDRLWHRWERK